VIPVPLSQGFTLFLQSRDIRAFDETLGIQYSDGLPSPYTTAEGW